MLSTAKRRNTLVVCATLALNDCSINWIPSQRKARPVIKRRFCKTHPSKEYCNTVICPLLSNKIELIS